jgi:hypothetical protein
MLDEINNDRQELDTYIRNLNLPTKILMLGLMIRMRLIIRMRF